MIDVKVVADKNNKCVMKHLSRLDQHYKSGIHEAYIVIGEYLKRTNKEDFRAKKSGRFYRIRVNGRIINHRASGPFEPPARLTGALERTIKTKTSGFNKMEYSAGGGRVNYAGYLENGTSKEDGNSKMEPRPYMSKAIRDNEGKTVITFYRQIGRRLQCV